MTTRFQRGTGRKARSRNLAFALAFALPLAACDTDSLLEVDEPTFATPESLQNPAGLPVLYAGAIGDFQIAYSGSGGDSFLSVSSVFSDELYVADTFTTRNATDQRDQFPTVQGNTSDAAYNRLQYARRSAAEVAAAVAEFAESGQADPRYAVTKALEGFAIVALAEGFCGAVPLGTASGGAPGELGTPLTTQQLFTEAVARFDAAIAANPTGTGSANALNLARVGKGRALLNNGDYAGAAAAVAAVPDEFVHFIEHSTNSNRQHNPLFSLMANGRYSVADREGGTGLPFRSANDPRTPWWQDPAGGFDSAVPMFMSDRYSHLAADVVLADGIEARLIEAEAALQANDIATWLAKLNGLRAKMQALLFERYDEPHPVARAPAPAERTQPGEGTLAPLTDPGTPAARVDLMFSERAFWLYLTGHRHGDLRRLIRQYGRTQAQVFPTGTHHRGGTYGSDVTFPIPFQESQNTNYDIGMCNVQQA